jgi:hypothetical protein
LRIAAEGRNVLLDPFNRKSLIKESGVLFYAADARHARKAEYGGAITGTSACLRWGYLLGRNDDHVFLVGEELPAINGVVRGSFGKTWPCQ